MNDFLNPKSMLTPGASGALVMVLANSLCLAFPEMAFRYIAIGLSFVLGLLVFQAVQMAVGQRVIYWILNSLIIFTMGVGATTIGAKLEGFQEAPLPAARASATAALSLVWMLSDAQAQTSTTQTTTKKETETSQPAKEDKYAKPKKDGGEPSKQPPSNASHKKEGFFRKL